ncbi:MAG: type II secretion system F family protein [Rhodospirillales bacterium]|nr:type II secretion system F family protein [Rhodospirillales bacterium]
MPDISDPSLIFILAAVVMALVAIAAVLLWQEAGTRELEARIAAITSEVQRTGRETVASWLLRGLFVLGRSIREHTRLYSEDDLASLGAAIAAAGLNPKQVLPIVLGAKISVMALLPAVAIGYGALTGLPETYIALLAAGALPLGILGPEWVLQFLRRPYHRDLQRGAADALDLLVVCAEAGMALEPALEQVAREMRSSNRAMSMALATLVDELRVLPDRRLAFENFGQRSGVDGLRRMSAIIGQSLQYGTPLGQALRAVAAELRRDRRTRMEAKAVRLPAMLVFPLIAFILPTLFIALLGPGVLQVMDTLGRAGQK